VTEHRDDLSTADLAGQRPGSSDQVEHVEDAGGPGFSRSDVDGSSADRSDVDRSGLDGSTVDRDGLGRSDVDQPGRSDVDGSGSGRDGDLPDGDLRDGSLRDGGMRGGGMRDGDAGSDGYDTDVTPAQRPGGSTVADPDALDGRQPNGTAPVNGSTGPGADTAGPLDGSTGPGVDTTGPAAGTTGPTAGTTGPGTSGTGPTGTENTAHGPLLGGNDTEGFRARWTDVQTGFVDEPRRAVEQADGLVAELMQHLAKTFADERSRLEGQWDRGDDVPTDDLRTAFQRYRSFFERLLAT
jgi:hypothetical protein